MRRIALILTLTALASATPALAHDGQVYAGVDGGIIIGTGLDLNGGDEDIAEGYDIDGFAGYDFGLFRVEGEAAYKHVEAEETQAVGLTPGVDVSVISGMVNGLFELGDENVSAYAGGGVGYAHVKQFGDSDNAFAWQLIAGASVPVSSNVDVGLKYRYFRTAGLNFHDDAALADSGVGIDSNGKFSSHSVLASLIYHFGAPGPAPAPIPAAAPAPPPPPPPATQTCPDGSVILATDVCAAPPPPPPPPAPPAGERG